MNRKILAACLIAAIVLLGAVSAGAANINFGLDFEYTGGDEPAGQPPWLVADFEDVGLNQVRLTIDTFGLVEVEFIPAWFFNLSPQLNAEFLSFSFAGGTGLPATLNLGNDAQDAAGVLGKGFDIKLSWSTNQGSRFIADKFIYYIVTYSDPDNPGDTISASSFNFFNPGGFLSAAHVQGISPGDGSGWIAAVPIPASVWLFGSGMLLLVALRKRFNG